jgi:hypothetical protein
LIIAEDVDGQALAILVVNNIRGIRRPRRQGAGLATVGRARTSRSSPPAAPSSPRARLKLENDVEGLDHAKKIEVNKRPTIIDGGGERPRSKPG